MMERVVWICKILFLKIKYRNKILLNGFVKCDLQSKIKVIEGKIVLGQNFKIKPYSYIVAVNNGLIEIQNNVYVNRNCSIVCHNKIHIGENTSIGPNVIMYDHDHRYGENGIEDGFTTSEVIIEKNCWIGAGVILLKGTHIGEGTVIGAGCVVKGNIPPHSLVTSENRNLIIKSIINNK